MPTCSRADSPGWANKKAKYSAFFKDPRNIVLMGCADGVNPWKNVATDRFLLVVFAVWNLPSEIRMKRETLILLGMTDSKPRTLNSCINWWLTSSRNCGMAWRVGTVQRIDSSSCAPC